MQGRQRMWREDCVKRDLETGHMIVFGGTGVSREKVLPQHTNKCGSQYEVFGERVIRTHYFECVRQYQSSTVTLTPSIVQCE